MNFLTPLFDNQTTFEPATFTSFTPKVGLNYQLSDAVFAYASASRGFKSGGFNIGSYQNTPFNPEKIWSYEAGVKTDLLERRLRLNLAAFYYDYTDLQVQDVEGNNTVVRNAASAVIQGLELETTALLGTAVQLDLAATYLDSEFRDSCLADPKHPLPQPEPGCTGPNQRNLEGLQLPRAPELKLSVGAQYTLDLPNTGQLILRGDYSHQSRIYFSAFEVTELSQEGYGWAKARLAYVAPGGQLAAGRVHRQHHRRRSHQQRDVHRRHRRFDHHGQHGAAAHLRRAVQGAVLAAMSFDAEQFRAEVRAFCREHFPADLARKADAYVHFSKADRVRWQRLLRRARVVHRALAGGVRRPGLGTAAALHLHRGAGVRGHAVAHALRRVVRRAVDLRVRQRRSATTLSAGDPQLHRVVVPGLLRARRRLRPGVGAHARAACGR